MTSKTKPVMAARMGSVFLIIIAAGCKDKIMPPPRVGVDDWKPRGIGGPVEVRPLPPADRVVAEWEEWLNSESMTKGRVYEIILTGASNQLTFNLQVEKTSTPVGNPEKTFVSFFYKDPTNGVYEFSWSWLGRHKADFLKLGNQPKTIWVRLNSVKNREGIPLLQIEAVEGLQSAGILAEPGRKGNSTSVTHTN